MLTNVFLKSLRDQFRGILGWGLGLASLAYVTLLFFPAMTTLGELDQLLQSLPQLAGFLGDIVSLTTIEGYVTSQLLAYMPVILSIYLILAAVNTITGEIESGTMDFLLAHPIPRWRVVLEKYGALVVAILAIALLLALGMWLGGLTIGEDVSLARWMLAALNLVPITLLYGSIAFMLACAFRGRGIAIGVAAGLAVGGFILNGLVPLSETLRPYREWTIYYLFTAGRPFSSGLDFGYTAILLGGSLICLVVSLVAFEQRDIIA